MKLCLNCRTVAGSAANFCPKCQYTFGGRRCSRGHDNPRSNVSCQVCGGAPLSPATSYVDLGMLTKIAAATLALVVVALFFGPAIGTALLWLWQMANGLVSAIQFAWRHPVWLFERLFIWALLGAVAWRLMPSWIKATAKWLLRGVLRYLIRR